MYISKISLNNHKLFKGDFTLDLLKADGHLPQWTVFLGNNNSGKTSLLKAIADLEPHCIFQVDNKSNSYTSFHLPQFALRNKGNVSNTNKDVTPQIDVCCEIVRENPHSNAKIDQKNLGKLWLKPQQSVAWGYDSKSGLHTIADGHTKELFSLKIYGYGVNRKVSPGTLKNEDPISNSVSLFTNETSLRNFEDWLLQLDYSAKNGREGPASKRMNIIRETIFKNLFPDIIDFRFQSTPEFKNYIEFQTINGWCSIEDLGYGYQSTIAWILDLCIKLFERYPESPIPTSEPAVVLVDEIDLHLHPKWQKQIIQSLSLTFPSTQFIVTTHSPFVIQTLNELNLFVLNREGDKNNIQKSPWKSFEGWSVEEILSDLLEMEKEGSYSDLHNSLISDFFRFADKSDAKNANEVYLKLAEILHPESASRKILKLHLSQIYDKA